MRMSKAVEEKRREGLREQGKMKTVAIVTGAAGGIGVEFVRELLKEDLDEIWAVGRNAERLEGLRAQYGERIVPICADLTDPQGLAVIRTGLENGSYRVSYLINNAGIAKMAPSKDFTDAEIGQTVGLNCTAPVLLVNHCLPFMGKGSRIINVCSASAFQPVPYINLYAATKAFERSYSRALHVELKPLGITVTAVCPSWVDTGMLKREANGKPIRFPGMVAPACVAQTAMRDAKKGKDMSVCSLYVKCQHLNVKLLPQKWTMKIWMRGIRKYM